MGVAPDSKIWFKASDFFVCSVNYELGYLAIKITFEKRHSNVSF